MTKAPHLLPYQGSKRKLAGRIIALCGARRFARFFEPFAGSAALTIAAAQATLARHFVLGDSLAPLAALWQLCIDEPGALSAQYELLWRQQQPDPRAFYADVRAAFNRDADPAKLLYLLARCVKNAPRFAADGSFNQSADHRRLGRAPALVAGAAAEISALLKGRVTVWSADFEGSCADATPDDLVYLDPPWVGTTTGRDKRYHQGLSQQRLLGFLRALEARGVPWLLSYDGRLGRKRYGQPLPADLGAMHLELDAGRSSQATLSGRRQTTYESLYVCGQLAETASALCERLEGVAVADPGASALPG